MNGSDDLARTIRAADRAHRVFGWGLILIGLFVAAACVVAPLQGNWTPDVGIGIASIFVGIVLGFDRWTQHR